ncbi:hypothetical protein GCM10011505_34860 [Tistrella bauzanensis]|uniref:Uncharacterized protein n=1 Tax=Tistrella bauzanensis TaxID=657419 RepID=A0ABQ1IRL4_9PROT|nr:hypothetical protein GCM10011505_34860 [Tistrella bauzanensis]
MAAGHVGEHGCDMQGSEGQRRRNPQAAAKVAGGQDRFPGHVDLGADPGGMVAEGDTGFRERRTPGGSREKLDAKFRFKPEKPATDDRFGDAEPERRGGDAPGIGDFNECAQRVDIQGGVPHFATQFLTEGDYRIAVGTSNIPSRQRR